jgi:hypothetical protein
MPFIGGNENLVNQYTNSTQTTSLTNSIAGNNERPMQSIGMDANGNLVVTWASQGQDVPGEPLNYGVYARRYDVKTQQWGTEFLVNQDGTGGQLQGNQLGAGVVVNDDGSFIVTWTDGSPNQAGEDYLSYGVYARRYDSAGNSIGNQFRINQITTGDQFDSSIAINTDGDFVVSWTSNNLNTNGKDIFVRRFNKDGTPKDKAIGKDNDILTNTFTTNDQLHSSVAIDSSGNFVVVWESSGQDGSGTGIYGQRFNADGSKNGSEFSINVITTNDQLYPSVSMDAKGNFVVTWTSNTGVAYGSDIYARRYDSTGKALDAQEFLVNSQNRADNQQYSQVKLLNSGNFIITWTGPDASATGIYGRLYSFTTGAPLAGSDGDEFLVNTTTDGNQRFSDIAGNSKGNFAISWTSNSLTTGDDVYIKNYSYTAPLGKPPTDITLSATSIDENKPALSGIGAFSTVDPDSPNDPFVYSLVTGTGSDDNGFFEINNNQLQITTSPNSGVKSSYSIRVRTTDANDNLTFEKIFTIKVNNLPPTDIGLSKTNVGDNAPANTVIGAFSTIDPTQNDTFKYSLVDTTNNPDNNSFIIINGNQLQINKSPNFTTKPSYTIRVRTTDSNQQSVDKTFTITVDSPTSLPPTDIGLSKTNVDDSVPDNTIVGTLSTTDPTPNDTFQYSLIDTVNNPDNNFFTIVNGDQLQITKSPSFATKSSYTIRLRTTDKTNLSFDKTFTITVNNLPPTDISLSKTNIDDNAPANTVIGILSSTDPTPNDTFQYSLIDTVNNPDNNFFTIVNDNQLQIVNSPSFTTKPSYTIRLRTTDKTNLSFDKTFTITVNNLASLPPTDISLSKTNIDDNAPANTVIGILSSTDPNPNDTFQYSLIDTVNNPDNNFFTIVNGNQLQIVNSPSFTTKSSYTIRLRTTDKTNLSFDKTFTITVNNLPPTDISLSKTNIDENVSLDTVVGTFSTVDLTPNDTFKYFLVQGFGSDDNGSFEITDNQLKIRTVPNSGIKPNYTIRVKTVDSSGLSFEKVFTIQVNNLAPTDIGLSKTDVDENVPANTVVGTFSTVDATQGDTFTYALVSGTGSDDNNSFQIVNNQLQIKTIPNSGVKSSYSIRVQTTDNSKQSFEKVFTIQVNNLAPTDIGLSKTNVDENVPANTVVGTFSTTDPTQGDTFTYSLVGTSTTNPDNSFFTIVNGNQLQITAVPNFGTKPSYSIKVRTTDKSGSTFDKVLTITVNNLAPTDIGLSKTNVDENIPANTVVGTFSTVDLTQGDTFKYALVSGTGSDDNSSFMIVNNQLQITTIPNSGVKPSYSIRVKTTDKSGASFEKVFTITVNNLAPTDIGLSKTNVDENVPANTVVGTFSTTDPTQGDTFTYLLVRGTGGDDNDFFEIKDNQLQIKNTPNIDTKSSYSIRVKTTDQSGASFEKVFTIGVNRLYPPTITTSPGNVSYKEGVGELALDSGVIVQDVDSLNLEGATVRIIGGFVPQQDFLTVPSTSGITANYSAATGVLTLTGTASVATYQTVLRSLTYRNSSGDPSTAPRIIAFTVRDAAFTSNVATRTLQVIPVDTPPVVTVSNSSSLNYLENSGEVAVDAAIIVSDVDSPNLKGATIQLSNYDPQQDQLSVIPPNGISSNFDATTGRLSLSGTAPVASYQAALRSVTYVNNSSNPSTTPRIIQFSVRDSSSSSNIATRIIQVTSVNSPPVVTTSGSSFTYVEKTGKQIVDPQLTITDLDSQNLLGVTVQLQNVQPDQDSLSLTTQSGITSSYNAATGVLSLTGTAPVAVYQGVLRSLTYTNSSNNPNLATRVVQFIAQDDGGAFSQPTSRSIQILPINDPPVLTLSVQQITFTQGQTLLDPQLSLSDVDSNVLTGATITIGNYIATEDNLLFQNQSGITGSFDRVKGVLRLTGAASVLSYQAALRSVQFSNSQAIPTATPRILTIQVTDSSASSDPASGKIQVQYFLSTPIPTIDLNGGAAGVDYSNTFVLSGPPISVVSSDAQFTNQAYPVLTSAQVRIVNPLNGAGELLSADTSGTGIRAVYDAQNGVLTLTGRAATADYLRVLRSIQYQNSRIDLDATTRAILFQVSNGDSTSPPAQTRVQISQIKLATDALTSDNSLFTTPATDLINVFNPNVTVVSTLANLQQNDSIKAFASGDTFMLLDGDGTAVIDLNNSVNQVSGILTGNTTITGFDSFRLSDFTGNATMFGNDRNNTLVGGMGNDRIYGGSGDDLLVGGTGNDLLHAGSGNDTLIGGPGRDTLVGGPGQDQFVLTEARRRSSDVIRKFRPADDTIVILRSGFSQKLPLGQLRASAFCLGTQAERRSDRFVYDQSSGALFFDRDGSGNASQVQIARIANRAALSPSNIVIVDAIPTV